ncbi:MAG: choice-of-anchor L domain-containing protein [Saprospirales bacterium]|nr:choice-of-anchor L domain-containing protein [Saprospirales bacterium]
MRKLLTLLFLFISIAVFAQAPVNDDCPGIIDLGIAPWCDTTVFYTNFDATPTNVGNDNIPNINNCSGLGEMDHDVWFSFIASDTIADYLITVTGVTDGMGSVAMNMPQIAIYRGDCEFDGMEILDCRAAPINENVVELELSGLDAGLPYFVRISDYSATAAANWGTFQLCIIEKPPVVILDENQTTTLCSGEIYDSGGPDGDYSPNQNFTFTIMPPGGPACITFTLVYYNIALTGTDAIRFYNGPNTTSPLISQVQGGQTGGGSVSYTVQANSGSLTVQFISDGSIQLDGFYGTWECSTTPCDPPDLITVDGTVDTLTIIDYIASSTTEVTITNINCNLGAYGTFDAGDYTNLGLTKGLVLTSGRVADNGFQIGINHPGSSFASTSWGAPGDADLNTLSLQSGNGTTSTDACVIEVDVYAATDELTFEYIFGSEEYPEYVNSSFNDIFAFLISGPGIVGDPGLNGQKNIAVLPPPASVPVQINSVNNQLNWEYYRNNLAGQSVVYDGLTSDFLGVKPSLTATSQVIPCNTYHIKLAIADRGDTAFDSGVFISDIKGGTPTLGVNYNNGIEYMVEECTDIPDEIILGLSSEQEEDVTYNVIISGTATLGVDYQLNIPSQITFPAGTTSFTFPISALADGIPEGVETIIIQLSNDFGCGEVTFEELVIELHDELQVEIYAGAADTAYVCLGVGLQMDVIGALEYVWSPSGVFTNPVGQTPFANPTQDTMVYVVGTLGVCFDIDSIYLDVVDPQVEIMPIGPTGICQGDTIALFAENNVGNSGLHWNSSTTILDPLSSPTVGIAPLFNTTYTVNVEIAGCTASDQITINVDPFTFPLVNFTDTIICQNYSVTLANQISGVTTTYDWTASPDDPTLTNPTASGPTVTPEFSTTYTLIATSQNAYCADTTSVDVIVIPANVEILVPVSDSLDICLGTSVDLTALTSTAGLGLHWIPDDGTVSDPTSVNPTVTPEVSTTYYATLSVGACNVIDSIHIRVDSIPFNEITKLIPDKESYCQGELITITSPNYEPANFPDIEHLWIPPVGHLTPDTLWNLVIEAVQTTTYQRITTNRACVDTAEVEIIVIPTAFISVEPSNSTICKGDTIQLTVMSDDPIDSYEWTPADGLSCTDCPNPIAFPFGSTLYNVEGEFSGCPVNAEAFIEVVVLPDIIFPGSPTLCPGDSIQLNTNDPDPNATYIWTAGGTLISNDPNPWVSPVVTTTYEVSVQKPGCDARVETVTVVVLSEPPVLTVSGDALICIGDAIELSASADVPGAFLWSPGGETTSSITVQPSVASDYTVEFTSACFVLSETITVEVSPGFIVDSLIITPSGEVYEGTPLSLEAFTTPSGLLQPLYIWLLGQDTIGSGVNLNPFATEAPGVEEDGTIATYQVYIIDAIGCDASAALEILVNNSSFELPNAFTPDNDGSNDRFRLLKNEAVEILEFKVFNRWGQLVYNNENGDAGWDGTQNGKPAPSDAYAYLILIKMGDGQEVLLKGDVTLLR